MGDSTYRSRLLFNLASRKRKAAAWTIWTGVFFLSFSLPFAVFAKSESKFSELSVTVTADFSPPPSPFGVKVDREICGEQRRSNTLLIDPKTLALQNAVVWLEGSNTGLWPEDAKDANILIKTDRCEFEPRVVVMPPGATLTFTNNEHKILYSYLAKAKKNPPLYRAHPRNLATVTMRFNEPEIFPIEDKIHPWMRAFIVVAAHPLYAVSDIGGHIRFKYVPVGTYKLQLWHEALGMMEFPEKIEISKPGTSQSVKVKWTQSDN